MASSLPPVKGSAFTTEISLVSQADTDIFITSATLAAGDVVVYKDGVLDGNIDALPTEIGTSGVLSVTLSAAEMSADRVVVKFCDASGSQWQDALLVIHTVGQTFDGMPDAILARDIGSGTGAGTLDERTVRSALRFLRNKWTVVDDTLTVKKEDDSTTAWTASVTTSVDAEPVTAIDPAAVA
jgi:hypothetical protein